MSEALQKAVNALTEKIGDKEVGMVVVFDIEGEGQVTVDGKSGAATVSEGGGDADVTISASYETFEDLLSGALDPTSAYMTGKIKIDGSMTEAMKVASLLA